MQINRSDKSSTEAVLNMTADKAFIQNVKNATLKHLAAKHVKVPGFRPGTAPPSVVEKHVDQQQLQSEFLEEAINRMYKAVVKEENLRPIADPKISVKKFVPFDQLEVEISVEIIGSIKLADYKSIYKTQPKVELIAKDINGVIESLRIRMADRAEVTRGAKDGDEVVLDFKGIDEKSQPVNGAEGKDYPLILGSNTFVPGFEPNLVGLKSSQEKTFSVTFPKDYGVNALKNKKVTFTVKLKAVNELKKPELDNAFAAKAGPFKTLPELKADIKKQLATERQREADQIFQNEMLENIAAKSSVDIPKSLVDNQIERGEQDERQNLAYRGQTWDEHLKEEGVTAEEHREKNRPSAEQAVKISILLSEIAEREKLTVTPEELEIRLQVLKGQYTDPKMQTELDKPDNRQDIASRILTEKTIAKLTEYVTDK